MTLAEFEITYAVVVKDMVKAYSIEDAAAFARREVGNAKGSGKRVLSIFDLSRHQPKQPQA